MSETHKQKNRRISGVLLFLLGLGGLVVSGLAYNRTRLPEPGRIGFAGEPIGEALLGLVMSGALLLAGIIMMLTSRIGRRPKRPSEAGADHEDPVESRATKPPRPGSDKGRAPVVRRRRR